MHVVALGDDLRSLSKHEFDRASEARARQPRQRRMGECAFCGAYGDDLVVDHDHETGQIRGLVHAACNAAIGPHTKSSVQRLIDYLNRDVDLGTYPERSRRS